MISRNEYLVWHLVFVLKSTKVSRSNRCKMHHHIYNKSRLFYRVGSVNQAEIDRWNFSQIVNREEIWYLRHLASERRVDNHICTLRRSQSGVTLNGQTLINGDDNFHLQSAICSDMMKRRDELINRCYRIKRQFTGVCINASYDEMRKSNLTFFTENFLSYFFQSHSLATNVRRPMITKTIKII